MKKKSLKSFKTSVFFSFTSCIFWPWPPPLLIIVTSTDAFLKFKCIQIKDKLPLFLLSKGEKNVQSDRASNPGPLAYTDWAIRLPDTLSPWWWLSLNRNTMFLLYSAVTMHFQNYLFIRIYMSVQTFVKVMTAEWLVLSL